MKKFLFITECLKDDGYEVIEASNAKDASKTSKSRGYYPMTHQNPHEILEEYKSHWIVESKGGTIQVFNPANNTLFIVCMDDSKSCGHRTFDDSLNTVEAARNYIDFTMLKTEFIQDSKNATHLYVNGEKTNVYFFTPKYCEQFPWNGSHALQKRQAEKIKKFIDAGEMKPLDSESFDMFDICAGYRVDLSNTIILSEKVSYEREIFGCQTPYEITDDLKPELLKVIHEQKSFLTQYCKMIDDDKLLKRTGVYFYKYGYAVYFIE